MMAIMDPKISIVTVCFNAVKTIEQTIISIVNQSYNNMEYIVIDGQSTDGTIEIIKKYDKNISSWISEPDKGIYDAMNKALEMATGDFLIFLGADDHLLSFDTISNVVENIKDLNYVYYGDVYRNSRNDLYRGKFNKYLLACENICHQAIFYPKDVYKKYMYDLNFPVFADYAYNLKIWRICKFVYIPVCITYFNCMGASGKGDDEKYGEEMMEVIKNNLGFLSFLLKKVYLLLKRR